MRKRKKRYKKEEGVGRGEEGQEFNCK